MVLVLTPSTSFVAANLCVRYTGLFSQPLTSELGVQPLLSWSTLVGVGKAGPSHCPVSISIAYSERKPRSQDGLRTAYGHLELRLSSPNQPRSGNDYAFRAEFHMLSVTVPWLFSDEII